MRPVDVIDGSVIEYIYFSGPQTNANSFLQ